MFSAHSRPHQRRQEALRVACCDVLLSPLQHRNCLVTSRAVEVLAAMQSRLAPAVRLLHAQLASLGDHQYHQAALVRMNPEGRPHCRKNGVVFVGVRHRLGLHWCPHEALALLRVPMAVQLHYSGLLLQLMRHQPPHQLELLQVDLLVGTRRHGE